MAMVKKGASENHIIRGLIVISDAFKKVDITGDDVLDTMQAVDFIHYFDTIRDFRSPDMITYKLSNILMMVFLTILSDGINSFYGIADQIRICRYKYEKYGLIEDGKIPSHDTFRRVFSMLSVQELYNQTIQCFYDFLKNLEDTIIGRDSYKQLMIDGIENRWHIENGLHREKDMFLNEDLFRSSESNTVNCLAVMNNFAMQLIRIYQAVSGLELRHAKIYMRNYTLEGCVEILTKLKSEEVIAKIKEEMLKIKKLKLN